MTGPVAAQIIRNAGDDGQLFDPWTDVSIIASTALLSLRLNRNSRFVSRVAGLQ